MKSQNQNSISYKLAHIAKAKDCNTMSDCINAKDEVWKLCKEHKGLTPAMQRRLDSLDAKREKLYNKLRGY